MSVLRVIGLGWGTTVQDRGRVGFAALGVSPAGAVDRPSHDRVNRLVGNAADAATLETHRGLVVEAMAAAVVAASTDGALRTLQAGERLRVDAAPGEMWAYLGIRGGVQVEPVLGSRSHDTLSGIGPPPLSAGDELDVGPDPRTPLPTDLAPRRAIHHDVRIWPGPQLDELIRPEVMTDARWTVTTETSRIGVRLGVEAGAASEAPTIAARARPSEGLVEGAVQLTPSGQPIVMLANHPTTGGYPVVAVVDPDDVAVVAQAPPGSVLRFWWVV